jgi:hypothetical protein
MSIKIINNIDATKISVIYTSYPPTSPMVYNLSIFKIFGIKNLNNKLKVMAFSATTQIYSKVRNQEERKLTYRSKSKKLKVKAPSETGKRSPYCVLVLYLLLRM